ERPTGPPRQQPAGPAGEPSARPTPGERPTGPSRAEPASGERPAAGDEPTSEGGPA
ncbi:DUF2662 domain-containing protein, partial [Micromonospora globispora]